MQRRLNQVGARLSVDGDYGARTRSAVITFQRGRRLYPDGVVGAKTSAALARGSSTRPSTPAARSLPRTRAELQSAVDRYVRSRGGVATVAVFDPRNGVLLTTNGSLHTETLSIVKVLILGAILDRSESQHRNLTARERSLASSMIRSSNNSATDALVRSVGSTAVQRFARSVGMDGTRVNGGTTKTPSWWGYSTTTALDQVRLMNSLVDGSSPLTRGHEGYVLGLMRTTVASQRWGVADGAGANGTAVKNGWGPFSGGYRLNSIGYVNGGGRTYTIAILTRSPRGSTYGKTTANGISRLVYDALRSPLR